MPVSCRKTNLIFFNYSSPIFNLRYNIVYCQTFFYFISLFFVLVYIFDRIFSLCVEIFTHNILIGCKNSAFLSKQKKNTHNKGVFFLFLRRTRTQNIYRNELTLANDYNSKKNSFVSFREQQTNKEQEDNDLLVIVVIKKEKNIKHLTQPRKRSSTPNNKM